MPGGGEGRPGRLRGLHTALRSTLGVCPAPSWSACAASLSLPSPGCPPRAQREPTSTPELARALAKSPVGSDEPRSLEASPPPPPPAPGTSPVLPRLPTVGKGALAGGSSAARWVRYCCFGAALIGWSEGSCLLRSPSPVVLGIFRMVRRKAGPCLPSHPTRCASYTLLLLQHFLKSFCSVSKNEM